MPAYLKKVRSILPMKYQSLTDRPPAPQGGRHLHRIQAIRPRIIVTWQRYHFKRWRRKVFGKLGFAVGGKFGGKG